MTNVEQTEQTIITLNDQLNALESGMFVINCTCVLEFLSLSNYYESSIKKVEESIEIYNKVLGLSILEGKTQTDSYCLEINPYDQMIYKNKLKLIFSKEFESTLERFKYNLISIQPEIPNSIIIQKRCEENSDDLALNVALARLTYKSY